MIIDYIYLILIIVLILCILFIIYLSYEYRITESFAQVLPISNIPPPFDPNAIINQGQRFINNYNNYINNTMNIQRNKDNINKNEYIQKIASNQDNLNKIKGLSQQLETVASSFPVDKLIKTIKSKYNSQYLSSFTKDLGSYSIIVNDKCLTVNGLCKDEFCTLDCQKKINSSNSQNFTTNRIYNDSDAASIMNISTDDIASNNVYPYNIFRSSVNNKCLTMSDDGITVDTCDLNNIKQQWSISPNENICVLN